MADTQLKLAQVVSTALLVEQCRNNVVQRTMSFTIVSTMLFSIGESTTVVETGENNIARRSLFFIVA